MAHSVSNLLGKKYARLKYVVNSGAAGQSPYECFYIPEH